MGQCIIYQQKRGFQNGCRVCILNKEKSSYKMSYVAGKELNRDSQQDYAEKFAQYIYKSWTENLFNTSDRP